MNVPIQMNPKDFRQTKTRVAIVGGGPGGLFVARHLEAKAGDACQITIFEASERPGGKIVTGQFSGVGPYEAGVAEIYDYSSRGPDPLKDLIVGELGLEIKHIEGGPCVLDKKIILTPDDLGRHFGERTRDEAKAFRARCAEMLSPEAFYLSIAEADNAHPWSQMSGEALLTREIRDETARRYIRAMAHSDVSAPPHQTNGLTYLKNVLMDVDGYMDIYSVIGGNEQIVEGLVNDLGAELRLNSTVRSVEPLADGTYRLEVDVNGFDETTIVDYVVLALPLTALSMIHWRSETLQQTIDRHIGYFDRPGHYLRATLLFKRAFWREHIPTDWFMVDAFDGCCVYDESARHDYGNWGALAFLIAGNAALSLANVSDERIERLCLDALPPQFAEAEDLLVDRRVHRWMASVNALPGGLKTRRRAINHRPEPQRLPGVIMVGDYLFDATLNGVLDSADAATDIILADILMARRALQRKAAGVLGADHWSKASSTEKSLERFFQADALADMLRIAWNVKKGARVLHIGSASGGTVAALRALGFDAYGVESNRLAHVPTPPELGRYNLLGELTNLPFEDRAFEAVVETGLCRLPREQVARAIAEISRVCRHGLVLGSVTTDLPIDLVERHDLLEGVQMLGSRWDWSEKLYAAGFIHALTDHRLDEVWKRATAAGAGPGHWYEDAESVLYCFYQRGAPPAQSAQSGEAEAEIDGFIERPLIGVPGAA
ncbi:MAG: amine oxidase [Methylocystaceae bacterium]|nr:MAG: amine oxidase [Methylocystaceae bacterium]